MGPVVLGQNKRLFLHILMVFIVLSLQACAVTYLVSQSVIIFIRNRVQREKEVKKKTISNARTQRNFNIHIIFHGMVTEADRMIFIHYIILKSIVR